MFYIIRKFTSINSFTDIGYLDTEADRDAFYNVHGTAFTDWVIENTQSDIDEWFTTNEYCYLIDTRFEIPEGLNLINNIENPEGV